MNTYLALGEEKTGIRTVILEALSMEHFEEKLKEMLTKAQYGRIYTKVKM